MKELTEEQINTLYNWDLSMARQKALEANPTWSEAHADLAVLAYRDFLHVAAIYKDEIRFSPHWSIDEIWHGHLLCSYDYGKLCNVLFGRWFHHGPSEGNYPTSQDVDSYALLCQKTVEHFGQEAHPQVRFLPYYPKEMPTYLLRRALHGQRPDIPLFPAWLALTKQYIKKLFQDSIASQFGNKLKHLTYRGKKKEVV